MYLWRWLYLADKHLKDEKNVIQVTLNANNHNEWTHGGEHIEAVVVIEEVIKKSRAKRGSFLLCQLVSYLLQIVYYEQYETTTK